jgi:hypothetical protein
VNLFDATIFGFTAWRLCLVAGLVLLYFVLKFHWAREEERAAATSVAPGQSLSPKAKPGAAMGKLSRARAERAAIGLSDTQRIDHLHRRVALKAGDQADLKDLTFGRLSQLRVTFVGVEHASGREFARIKVLLGGAEAECGASVQQLDENDFLMPRGAYGDQNSSVHYTCGKGDAVSHLELRVSEIDVDKRTAAIEVLHVRGRRAV